MSSPVRAVLEKHGPDGILGAARAIRESLHQSVDPPSEIEYWFLSEIGSGRLENLNPDLEEAVVQLGAAILDKHIVACDARPGRSAKNPNGMLTYFIRAGSDGPIKIGMAVSPKKRLTELQTGHPELLLLLIATDLVSEAEAHARWAACRLRGEWFRAVPELLSWISDLSMRQAGP